LVNEGGKFAEAEANGDEEAMTADDQPIKVYRGEPADVVFLESLMEAAGIVPVRAGVFFGPTREIYVKRSDEAEARELVADFQSRRTKGKGVVVRGPWKV
jgi:hypothetical protein